MSLFDLLHHRTARCSEYMEHLPGRTSPALDMAISLAREENTEAALEVMEDDKTRWVDWCHRAAQSHLSGKRWGSLLACGCFVSYT